MNAKVAKLTRLVEALDFDNPTACIMSSLVLRDALLALGYSARVKSVSLLLRAARGDEVLHSLGVGLRDFHGPLAPPGPGWDGHLVTIAEGHLIDPMLPHYRRNAWKFLPEHPVLIPLLPGNHWRKPLKVAKAMRIVAAHFINKDDYEFQAVWFANPAGNNEWPEMKAAKEDRTEHVRDIVQSAKANGLSTD